MKTKDCPACNGSGFSLPGTGYDDVCDNCEGGQIPDPSWWERAWKAADFWLWKARNSGEIGRSLWLPVKLPGHRWPLGYVHGMLRYQPGHWMVGAIAERRRDDGWVVMAFLVPVFGLKFGWSVHRSRREPKYKDPDEWAGKPNWAQRCSLCGGKIGADVTGAPTECDNCGQRYLLDPPCPF